MSRLRQRPKQSRSLSLPVDFEYMCECLCREAEAIRAVNLWTCLGDFLNPVDPQMAELLVEACGERSVYV